MSRALRAGGALLALGALAWLGLTLAQLRAATQPPTPEARVQAAWAVYRKAPGHVFHVGEEGLECRSCHRPEQAHGYDHPGPAPCVSCHEEQASIEHVPVGLTEDERVVDGGVPATQVSNCVACHGFGPDPNKRPEDCLGCHARPQDDVPAVELHTDVACTKCHDVHENAVEPMDCQRCHTMKTDHGAREQRVAERCLDCHDAHSTKDAALASCTGCHAQPGAARFVGLHAAEGPHDCVGCHTPHGAQGIAAVDCGSCHGAPPTLAPRAHGACTSCHTPHDLGGGRARQRCAGCHGDLALHHGGEQPRARDCTSCHVPHPPKGQAPLGPQARCQRCHEDVATQGAAHAKGLSCTDCHAPHGPTPLRACAGCHAEAKALTGTAGVPAHPGHDRCQTCHEGLPHQRPPARKECAECHQDKHAEAAQGHQRCIGCHAPHAPKGASPPTCERCHAEQRAHTPRGHRECVRCHEPHRARLAANVADCSACHARGELPGLHSVAEHGECRQCHTPHSAAPVGARDDCLGCHDDRRDHEPGAKLCGGCHVFRAGGAR